nr:hypothetical protein [Tanacetum cinerariifolium]
MSVLLAKERILKLIQAWDEKQIKSWSLSELLLQLLNDLRTIDEMLKQRVKQREQTGNLAVQQEQEEHAVQSFTPYWNFSMIDDEEVLQAREILENDTNLFAKDESSPIFTTISNPIFNNNDDFTSSDDESFHNEDVLMENFKIYSNSLFDDEEINSDKIAPHYFNAESDLIESLSNRDTLFDSSPKFDYLEEFSGELMPTSIVNKERIKREHGEYISLIEKLLTINSFPRPLEIFHTNTIIETLPTSHIPVEDNDSLREEIDIFTGTDDLMPPGIKSDDYDSKGDIHFLKELFRNDSRPLPENESSNFDHHDDPSFPRPPPEPPDLTYPEVSPLLLSTRSEDTIFDPGICT